MKMRARDLKVYVIILIFFLVCLIAITAVYQAGVDTATVKNAYYQSESAYDASCSALDASIAEYNTLFVNGSDSVEATNIDDSSIFGDNTYAISSDGYVYYVNGSEYGRVALQTVMANALNDEDNAILLIDNGTVIGSNVDYNSRVTSLLEILTRTNSATLSNKILDKTHEEGREVYKARLTVTSGENDGYIVVDDYSSFKLLRFVDSDDIITTNDVNQFRLMYWIGAGLLLLGIVINFIFLFKKLNKGQALDAGISLRGSNAVVVCKVDGKIISYNRPFKAAFETKSLPISSMNDLTLMDTDLPLKDLIKEQRKFVLGWIGMLNEEGVKEHDDVYFEFYSAKRGTDYSLIGKDITKEYIDHKILIEKSTKSLVTGDDNGVVLDRRYREVKEKYKSVKDPYLFIMVNLRGFKDINTLLGFDQGNDVLKFFSEKLHEFFDGLEIFHTKGDEFVILDENSNEVSNLKICDRMLEELKAPIQINNNEIMLRPAFGVLGSDMDGETDIDYDMLISKLTTATNRAKGAGRNVCKYDVNLENSAMKDREMEEDLKLAIQRGEFVMYYQPQYELNQERVCGFEALLRWNNPKYATISPEVYIKMAEKNGFIIDVGNFINADVFKTAKEMEQYDIHISVNVSPAQIVQAGFVADFLEKFEENGLRPGAIALEVTETFLMENFSTVIEKLQILKNRGISIHLDDFGTGYSSMLYLKELPIDTIKVDKEFIKHIESDRFSKVLTSKIITLGKELGDKVICEGVETKIQKDIVHKFGADIIQGYYIGKALSKEDAFALLKTGKVSSENKSNGKLGEE